MTLKQISLFAVSLFTIAITTSAKAESNLGTLVDIAAQNLFVPVGFDDNDEDVSVVLEGYLPDTCHKIAPAEVTKDFSTGQIRVQAKARRFDGMCLDMIVPFTQVVKLGQTPRGTYLVTTNLGKLADSLLVRQATNAAGPDDYFYAPIDSATIVYLPNNRHAVKLQGRFTSSCGRLQDIKIYVTNRTVQVLPIMGRLEPKPGETCRMGEFPFEATMKLPKLASNVRRALLHVRSLDGQSVNTVFSVGLLENLVAKAD